MSAVLEADLRADHRKRVPSATGRIVLPRQLREKYEVRPGDVFELIDGDELGVILLRKRTRRHNEGLVDALLACPHRFAMPKRRRAGESPARC